MTDDAWIGTAIGAARSRSIAALVRYFGDLDAAEDAFQDACLRAVTNWPANGLPLDPTAWLIRVARNAGVDAARRTRLQEPLPLDAMLSGDGDNEAAALQRMDDAHYRDDMLRLLFICCHPALPATHQIALALRIVSGLSVRQIARAFLVSEAAMEQRITRAKRTVGAANVPFETPSEAERAVRLGAVSAMIYLLFNEGYSTPAAGLGAALCDEGIRLSRLLVRLFPGEPEVMGLNALLALQHARMAARVDGNGALVLLEDQDRKLWNRELILEGLALVDKAMRHRRPGPYQLQAAIAAMHARAVTAADTDWQAIDQLYAALEGIQPSPVVTLNRAVAVSKLRGPDAALAMIDPLGDRLAEYFYFHGLKGALLVEAGRSAEAMASWTRALAMAGSDENAAYIRARMTELR